MATIRLVPLVQRRSARVAAHLVREGADRLRESARRLGQTLDGNLLHLALHRRRKGARDRGRRPLPVLDREVEEDDGEDDDSEQGHSGRHGRRIEANPEDRGGEREQAGGSSVLGQGARRTYSRPDEERDGYAEDDSEALCLPALFCTFKEILDLWAAERQSGRKSTGAQGSAHRLCSVDVRRRSVLLAENCTGNDVADAEERRDVADDLARRAVGGRYASIVYTLDREEPDVGGQDDGGLYRAAG